MTREVVEILLVEDSAGDIRLTQEAFKEGKLANHLHVAKNGEEAMALLRQEDSAAQDRRPDLILLDLNLPKKDGRQVLAEIKSDERLKHIPVVILTTSQADADIARTYDLHANCYITKPVDLEQFLHVVRSIQEFWFEVVRRPAS